MNCWQTTSRSRRGEGGAGGGIRGQPVGPVDNNGRFGIYTIITPAQLSMFLLLFGFRLYNLSLDPSEFNIDEPYNLYFSSISHIVVYSIVV